MKLDWEVKPYHGLGPLVFGMNRAQVATEAGFLGDERATRDLGQTFAVSEMEQAEIDEMIEFLGEEGARETLEAMRQQDAALSSETLVLFATGVQLIFREGALSFIQVPFQSRDLHFRDIEFFGEDPFPVLRALSEANTNEPLLKGIDCVFDKLVLTCFGFTEPEGDGFRSVAAPQVARESGDHSVSWGTTLDRTPDMLASYVRFRF